ncbi:MAG: histidine phosphatase family protein [Planctomycetes bacterium]|nr:histidine phosphatase family protein [Planctomycetota bacterium]
MSGAAPPAASTTRTASSRQSVASERANGGRGTPRNPASPAAPRSATPARSAWRSAARPFIAVPPTAISASEGGGAKRVAFCGGATPASSANSAPRGSRSAPTHAPRCAILELFLLRHAKAEPGQPGQADFDRPLAPKGLATARALGAYLRAHELRPELVLCSSARRTMETWQELRLEEGGARVGEEALYLASASQLLTRLRAAPDAVTRVLLIGHNPGLEDLSLQLVGSGEKRLRTQLEQGLPTCGFAHICFAAPRWRELVLGTGELLRFVLGKEL